MRMVLTMTTADDDEMIETADDDMMMMMMILLSGLCITPQQVGFLNNGAEPRGEVRRRTSKGLTHIYLAKPTWLPMPPDHRARLARTVRCSMCLTVMACSMSADGLRVSLCTLLNVWCTLAQC